MKNAKRYTGLLLIILTLSIFTVVPVSARRKRNDPVEGLGVSLRGVEVADLDGDGYEDDVTIYGTVKVRVSEAGRYSVKLVLMTKYIGKDPNNPTTRGRKYDTIKRMTVKIYCDDDSWTTKRFTIKLYNLEGWYRGLASAKCGDEKAKSNVIIFDPPGGSVGPVNR
ncbi:hypothetical protein GH157_03710 [archaeon]|nr:hypothetical protein [archaeon]